MTTGVNVRRVTEFPLASQTAGTVNSGGSAVPESFTECNIFVNTTVLTGTLDVRYQISPDDGATWYTKQSVTQITATGLSLTTIVDGIGSYYRIQSVVATGPITRSVIVEFKR